jgi:hypothetical protein
MSLKPSKKAAKKLQAMRESKANWKPHDLKTVYKGYGFIIDESGGRHDKATHPKFPHLIGYIPRHKELAIFVVAEMITIIDQLILLSSLEDEKTNDEQ